MADYVLPSVVEKRVRYFDGQFLQDQDFIDEQDYQLDREHRHNRLLHGPGITEGLAVTSPGPNQVSVSAGSAIDSDGRQLVLAQATTVDLPAADFNDKQGIQLLISYLESAEDPQTVGGSQDFTRWLERPALTALAPGETYSGSYPTVPLMALALDSSGRVTGDNSPRVYSGLLLPGLGGDAATLSAGSGGAVQLAGTLSVTGGVGIGLVPSVALHLAQGKALRIEAGTGGGDTTAYFSFGGNGAFNVDAPNRAGGRLTVQSSGNVGIGTATPGARLDVVGGGGDSVDLQVNGRLRSNSSNGGLWVSTDRFVGGDGGNNVGVWAGNAWRLMVTPGGNIGIGTGTPGFALHLATDNALRIDGALKSDPNAAYLSLGGVGVFNVDAPGKAGGRFTVQNSGKVGIGTGTPAVRLEVVGSGGQNIDLRVNGQLQSNSDNGGLWVSGDRFVGGDGGGNVGFYAGKAWRMLVAPGGNIGIGTGSPSYALHLATDKVLRIDGALTSDHNAAVLSLGGNGAFNVDAPNTVGGRFTVQNSGSVGVGTGTPGVRLDVVGSGGQNIDLRVNGRLQSNSNDGGLWVSGDRFVGGDGGTNVGFWAGNAWRMLVAPGGNIGIGTSSPTSRLHVSLPSTTSAVNAMQITVASFVTSGNAKNSNFLLVQDTGAGDPYVTIRGDGGAYFRGSLNYWWGPDNAWKNIQNRASDYAGSYSTGGPSDIRLKDDVRPIGPALDLVRQLQGVRYRWSEAGLAHFTRDIETSVSAGPDATPEQHEKVWRAERDRALDRLAGDRLGLIAQDVELVIPELVHQGDDGYKRIRYQHLTALLAEAIKEQDAAVRALSSEVAALRLALSAQAN